MVIVMLYTSIENKKIKELKKLNTKKYRDLNNLFIVEGEHLVLEAYKNGVLKELILGILICGGFFQSTLIWLAHDKVQYTTGLWIGIVCSVLKAVHMEYSIRNALERNEKGARNYARMMYGLRMALSIVLIGVTWYFKLGNILALFLGMFALKIGAFLQMPIHRFAGKKLPQIFGE